MQRVGAILNAVRARRRIVPLAGLLAAFLLAGRETVAEDSAAKSLEVSVHEGLVSLDARNVPLEDVLRAIAEQAGFRLVLKGDLSTPVTWSFKDVPVDRGVARLLGTASSLALYAPAPDGRGSVLAEVRVLRGSSDAVAGASGVARAAPIQPAWAVPAPTSEPLEEDPETRLERVRGLVEKGRRTTVRALSRFVSGDDDPVVRRIATVGLGNLRGPKAKDALIEALADEDGVVRQRAAQGLARNGGQAAIAPLRQALLEDPEPGVRRMAAFGLGRIDDDAAQSALIEAQSDDDPSVRGAVAAALVRLERIRFGRQD
ncbi:MAG: HEAT repeat domain-containing protein [Kiloniellaceae bacterium]